MENLPNESVKHRMFDSEKNKKVSFYAISLIVLFLIFYFLFLSAPADFPVGKILKIELGASLRSVSLQLKQEHIISFRPVFEFFAIAYGGEKHLIPADYLFEEKEPVWEVARRISRGERHLAPIKVTIPEGFNIDDIADTFVQKLVNFNKEKFLLLAKDQEGYLFPDTYFFFTTDTEIEALKSMGENFEKKITPLLPEIVSLGKNKRDIIIMASIIEGEAKGETDRGVISGILWKRISLNMPLQVDVALETYKTKGLPKSPVGNPGMAAILASIHPQNSLYLYYLHDKSGNIHYAKSFSEHQKNILKYLTQ
ncbi:endolytic transglycosylase MltG [Patescibacteria group bacterium]|nr:endolytic transglycosylase MltG [Patescibacteria group bacterium]